MLDKWSMTNQGNPIYVRARRIEDARQMVYDNPRCHNDKDAEIESEGWISMGEDGVIDDAEVHKPYPAFSDSKDQ